MNILLVCGSTTDVFIYNYVKRLKESDNNINIDVFGFYEDKQQQCPTGKHANIFTAKNRRISKMKYVGYAIEPCILKCELEKFLVGRFYDIIHCHWIVSPCVMVSSYKKHCKKLVCTFWGGERVNQDILYSKKLYFRYLDSFMKQVDYVLNGDVLAMERMYGNHKQIIFRKARLGSAPLDCLNKLMLNESKEESKDILSIPKDKLSVVIGYSGKPLHQHIAIVKELSKNDELKDKIHLVAPMTRGASDSYINDVRQALSESGFSFTLFSGKFMNDNEIARLRNASDVILQLSQFDGYSRSIIEFICAKALVIYGDWLNEQYIPHFKEDNIYAVSISDISSVGSALMEYIASQDDIKSKLDRNSKNCMKQNLWSECINDWVRHYKEALS